jgi:hypothetical protein
MNLEEILAELEYNTGTFPRLALERAIEEREAITPLLLAILEKYKDNLEELDEDSSYMLHIYSLFLLAQFRETKAYPLIIEFFSAPGEISLDVTGDVVTEYLGRILASVSGGNIEPLKQLIENPESNEFVRGAALDSLLVLVVQEVIPREQVIQYFEELFSSKFKRENSYIWSDLVVNASRLYPLELKEHIDQAYQSGLVDQFFISQKDVNYYLKIGLEACLKRLLENPHYFWIEDTISEMKTWACFREKETIPKPTTTFTLPEEFETPGKKATSQSKNKKKAQKESRRKNRPKKK